jgi:hypothetical protein
MCHETAAHLAGHEFCSILEATAVIHGSRVSGSRRVELNQDFLGRSETLPGRATVVRAQLGYMTGVFRRVVNIDQFSKSIARYIFRMERRKETDQETIELIRQFFSGGNRSEQAIPVDTSAQREQVGSASSKSASAGACSSRAEGDPLNLL